MIVESDFVFDPSRIQSEPPRRNRNRELLSVYCDQDNKTEQLRYALQLTIHLVDQSARQTQA